MYDFCTYFDHRYLIRGLALYQSLRRHCAPFRLWVLCMDAACYETLSALALPDVHLIAREDFEAGDEGLLAAKQTRSLIEYYFTCTPSLPLYVLKHQPDVSLITYLDADLFFFADPRPVYDEIADHSVAIIGHRFPPKLREREVNGLYNVGFLAFRRDEQGLDCLRGWREQCIEWCYDRLEGGRFADQKYLDAWPGRFPNLIVLNHKGANLAPWNIDNYGISVRDGAVRVDDQPLIFFHFHLLKRLGGRLYEHDLAAYGVKPTKAILRGIYAPYIRAMSEADRMLSPHVRQSAAEE